MLYYNFTCIYWKDDVIRKYKVIFFWAQKLCMIFTWVMYFIMPVLGLQQAFQGGIYSPSIGFTLGFGHIAKQLVALSGIFMGAGELLGKVFPLL